jgi:SNF2 family DNA or RNA helicase
MGLGKTITTVGLLLNNQVAYTLILGPIAVLDQWASVIKKTSLALYMIDKNSWKHISGKPRQGRVYLTNYDKLMRSEFFSYPWDRIMCDEAHIMRNYETKKYLELEKIKAPNKWFLTGTPIVNRINDLSALIHLIKPSVNPNSSSLNKGLEWMETYALQRTISHIRDTMPDILPPDAITIEHRLDFITQEEEQFYRGIQGRLAQEFENLMAQDRMDMRAFLALILRLRQIGTHPQVYIDSRKKEMGRDYLRNDWTESSTKTDKILDIMRNDDEAHGYVIFCHFNSEMDIIKKRLDKEGYDVFTYNGSMSADQRTTVIENTIKSVGCEKIDGYFLDKAKHLPKIPENIIKHVLNPLIGHRHTVLLAQIQTAGTGLNLQHMDRVIFTSPWWTAALMDQAIGRVVRIGQKKQVVIHHLTFKEEETLNIDEYINERVSRKRELCFELLAAANHNL